VECCLVTNTGQDATFRFAKLPEDLRALFVWFEDDADDGTTARRAVNGCPPGIA